MKLTRWIKGICWRLQFKKIKFYATTMFGGRCIDCDAGNPSAECSDFGYGCPCDYNQHLKRARTYRWLYKNNKNDSKN